MLTLEYDMNFNGASIRNLLYQSKILLLDDDQCESENLCERLRRKGYQVQHVHGALSPILEKERIPDMALVGERACGRNGLDVIAELKKRFPRLTWIFMASEDQIGLVSKALDAGAYDHLLKPLDSSRLQAAVKRCLGKIELEKEMNRVESELLEKNQALEDLNQRLRLTFNSMKTLAACNRINQLGRILLKEFAYNMAAQGGSIYFRRDDRMELMASLDPGHAHRSILLPLRPGSVFEEAVRLRQVVSINDINHRNDIRPSGWEGYRNGALIIFPFFDDVGDLFALLSLHNRVSPSFNDEDLEIGSLLTSFGNETIRACLANEALSKSESDFRHLFENLPDVFFRADIDGNINMVSPSVSKVFGYLPEEIKDRRNFCDWLEKPDEGASLLSLIMEKRTLSDHEIILRHKDGRLLRTSAISHCFLDEEGSVAGFEGLLRDVTAQKQAENDLTRLATAVEQATEVIYITDTDGIVQYANPSFERVTGYSRQEILGKKPSILKSGKHAPSFYRNLWKTLSRGEVWQGQFINRRKDGSLFEVEASITPIRDQSGMITNFVAVKRDMSREAYLLDQLVHSQKMEAIGSLAGGIAHDFNNILSAIIGNSELALIEAASSAEAQNYITRVLKASHRAKDLVNRILTFSRHSERNLNPTDITLIIREILNLLQATLPSTVEIRRDIRIEPAFVIADPTQIHQVIMNICTNAGHAMEEGGGTLSVRMVVAEPTPEFLFIFPGKKAENYLKLSISDTGRGMSEEILEHIFDPYFTTKKKGTGTGLGLTMALSIVRSCHGQIDVQSKPGHGSNFDIYLPLCEMDEGDSTTPANISLPRGREHILVVDDEEEIVQMCTQILEFLGYKVTGMTRSVDALEWLGRKGNTCSLVITDMTMPKMTGDLFSREIKRLRPDLGVILCSGFHEKIAEDKAKEYGIDAFLMKPVSMHDLAGTVREILDRLKKRVH